MRSNILWRKLQQSVRAGAQRMYCGRGVHFMNAADFEDVVAQSVASFWRQTSGELPEEQQLARAWHFGANGMRNYLRARRRPHSPHNFASQIPWEDLEEVLPACQNPENPLGARQVLEQVRQRLGKSDWEYLIGALEAESQTTFAQTLGVSRSAVSKRLREIRNRALQNAEAQVFS